MDVACVKLQVRWMLHALDQGATEAMDHEDSSGSKLLIKMQALWVGDQAMDQCTIKG